MNYDNIVNQLGLQLLEDLGDRFHFRCPICGDSQKSETKKRGWIYKNNNYKFSCYNKCGSMSFKDLIKLHFPQYLELLEESSTSKINQFKNRRKKDDSPIIKEIDNINVEFLNPDNYEIKIFDSLKEDVFPKLTEPYLKYCEKRLLPKHLIDGLRYCSAEPSSQMPFGQMLIFPFYVNESIYGFQGRNITQKRFHIYSQKNFKIYNIFNVNITEDVFIFESIIDSSYKSNSIAMLGSSLTGKLNKDIINKVFAFDNDETGYTKALEKVKLGEKVFIWPNEMKLFKDVNEFVVANQIKEYSDIEKMFKNNIYQGKEAEIKIKWICKEHNWLQEPPKYVKKEYDKFAYFKNKNKRLFNNEVEEENPDVMSD